MIRLSILLPWFSDDQRHEDTLASILANRPAQSEVLVVHRGAYDDPYDLGSEVRFIASEQRASLLEMVNQGAEEAEGDILHVLRGGLEVTEGWADAALESFNDSKVASVAPVITTVDETTVVSAGLRLSRDGRRQVCAPAGGPRSTQLSRLEPLAPTVSAGFFRIEAWDAASGFDERMGQCADIDLGLCLEVIGECVLATGSIIHQASPAEPLETGFQLGRSESRLHSRFAERKGLSGLGFWSRALLQGCLAAYRPTAWTRLMGQLLARRDQRDLDRFSQRWAELQAEAEELASCSFRDAA